MENSAPGPADRFSRVSLSRELGSNSREARIYYIYSRGIKFSSTERRTFRIVVYQPRRILTSSSSSSFSPFFFLSYLYHFFLLPCFFPQFSTALCKFTRSYQPEGYARGHGSYAAFGCGNRKLVRFTTTFPACFASASHLLLLSSLPVRARPIFRTFSSFQLTERGPLDKSQVPRYFSNICGPRADAV